MADVRASIEMMTRRTLFVFAGGFVFGQTRRPMPRKAKPKPEKPKPGVEKVEYIDPGTDAKLFRVTDPNLGASLLPPPHQTLVSRQKRFLLYVREQNGKNQAWTLDLGSWRNRPLTAAQALVPDSLTMSEDGRMIAYVDGSDIVAGPPGRSGKKIHTLQAPASTLDIGADAVFAAEGNKLLAIPVNGGTTAVVTEANAAIERPMLQPGAGSQIAFISGGALWVAAKSGGSPTRVPTAPGSRVTQARWSGGGTSLLYLLAAESGRGAVSLEEFRPGSEPARIANTSQYKAFTTTADSSVIFGVSGSKAAPIVFLMLRQNRRELAVCEHAAKDAASVRITLTPDNRYLFFNSDREGRSAIYMLDLEKLVEKSGS